MHGMYMKSSLMILVAALAVPAAAAPVLLLNDTFSDGERSTQSLPGSAQWFGPDATTPIAVADEKLVMPLVAKQGAMAFFAASPLTLAAGESLKMSFEITTPATGGQTGDNSFLYGFLDSGATRPTNDTTAFNNGVYGNDVGYFAVAPVAGAHALRNKIVQRTSGANNLTTSTNFSQIGDGSPTPNLTPGGTYTYSLLLVRDSETQITLTSNMGGVERVRVDDAGLVTSFDTIFIYGGSNPQITLDNVKVEYTSAIPEPASMGLLGLGLVMFGSRRRR